MAVEAQPSAQGPTAHEPATAESLAEALARAQRRVELLCENTGAGVWEADLTRGRE